jgi:hypothetical protein
MDALSDVLSAVRLDGAVYVNAEFTAPWCVATQFGLPLPLGMTLETAEEHQAAL